MLQKIIHRFLLSRHFWRYATFDEVAQLYTARLLRMTASASLALFSAVYLYKNGYSLVFIAGFYVIYFFVKSLLPFGLAHYIARFGPKHGMLVSNILNIPALLIFSMVPEYGLVALVLFSVFNAISLVMYNISHNVDFSKVKNTNNAGKEISIMSAMDKIAAGISPLVGGLVAWLVSPEATLWFAAALFLGAALPLFRTAEPVRLNQKISYVGFPWKVMLPSILARSAAGADAYLTGVVWMLFLTVTVFSQSGDAVYAQLGGLASLTLVIGFIVLRLYGKLIDKRKGGELLRAMTIGNTFVHFMRPFASTVPMVVLINIANEAMTSGHVMAFTRGMYDNADRSGHRIAYLMLSESAVNFGASLMSAVFLVIFLILPTVPAFNAVFIVGGLGALFIMSARFPLYRKK